MSESEKMAQALEFARYQSTINNQIDILRRKFKTDLIVAENGGKFVASLEFLNSLKTVIDEGINDVVLMDHNENPIFITNLYQFYKRSLDTYLEASDEYHKKYTELRHQRDIETIVGV